MDTIIYRNMAQMEQSHWWYKGRREIIGKLLTPFMHRPLEILDAGCGSGGTMEYMETYGSTLGVDVSEDMLEHCRKKGLQVQRASITQLPFEDHRFDVVLCLDVLEHLPEDRQAIEELKRVVKPGGLLVLSVPAFSWLWGQHDIQNNHYRRYDPGQLGNSLTPAELVLERSTYFNFFLLPTVWLVRKLGPKLGHHPGTDLELGLGLWNPILYGILKMEAFLLGYINLPLGVSQIVVARKK